MAIIKIKNFAKAFGKKVVHKNVTIDILEGECLGLLGGSGSGKSILLRSLIGLEMPDSGSVIVEGEDITQFNENELTEIRKKVAYVFQDGALFDSMNVYENLAYPLREHTPLNEYEIKSRITNLLDEFGLAGSEPLYPAELSGGMQKRVGLARAIILRPKVVLYDEPTAGLDPYNTRKIQEVILALKKKGVTSIFVTHDMPSAFAVCDRLALIQHGEIKGLGTQQDLKMDPNGLLNQFVTGKTA